ncbi:MAG: TraM recognition domain-containing protein, partial [Victivallaceae bacterium]
VGQMTAAIIKLCFEKMIERREDICDPDALPVFLWGDECQFFALEYDQKFQTTARSSRTLTVYATQNLDNLYDGYGKEKANSLLGNLGTKIFCQNGDHTTNKWAADSIGQEVLRRRSRNIGDSKSGSLKGDYNKSDNYSEGWSEQKDYKVDIVQFTTLQTGGPRGQCRVGYIYWQSGRVLKNGDVFVRGAIDQKCHRICGARLERHCPAVPKVGNKDTGSPFRFYWYDWLIFAVFMLSSTLVAFGLYLIYSEQDCFLLAVPEIGIITSATILIWFAGFALDAFWASLAVLLEILWYVIRKKPRHKHKVINRVPLTVITWLYLGFSLALAIYLQNSIYEQRSLLPAIGVWLAASIAHRLFKSAGGRKVPVD